MEEVEPDAVEWARSLRGDPSGFRRIFMRHHDRVLRHCLRVVPNPVDADDAGAIVFFEAWRRREHIRFVDESMLPWLLVTATNVTRNLRRSASRYRRLLDGLPTEDRLVDPTSDADEVAISALRRLSLNDQRVITLCVLEGYSEAEAATVLGIPRGTVKSRLSRAKQRLAATVNQQGPHLSTVRGELSHD